MNDYAVREWWYGGGRMDADEYAEACERAEANGGVLTDEPIGPRQPITMTVMGGAPAGVTPRPAKRTPPQQTFTCRGCQTVVPIRKGGVARVWCSESCRLRTLRREGMVAS